MFFDTSDPCVRWNVARGILSPVSKVDLNEHLISFFMRSRLIKAADRSEYYDLEIKLEEIRINKYPDKISRLMGFFAFETEVTATYAASVTNVPYWANVTPCEISLESNALTSKHDHNWITFRFEKEYADFPADWMDLYWTGQICTYATIDPIWEILINGRCIIENREIQQECHDRVASDLKCQFLLRLSICAAACGFDIGLNSYSLVQRDNCFIIVPVIRFDEKTSIAAIEQIKEKYPDQTLSIKPYSKDILCIMPDFRESSYCLTHKARCINCDLVLSKHT